MDTLTVAVYDGKMCVAQISSYKWQMGCTYTAFFWCFLSVVLFLQGSKVLCPDSHDQKSSRDGRSDACDTMTPDEDCRAAAVKTVKVQIKTLEPDYRNVFQVG